MMRIALLSISAALTWVAVGCTSIDSEELESDLTVEELLAKRQAATDPEGHFKNCKSYRQQQEIKTKVGKKEVTYVIEILYMRPSMFKTTQYEDGKATNIVLYNGEKAWNIDPQTEKSQRITGDVMKLVAVYSAMANPSKTMHDIFPRMDIVITRDRDSNGHVTAEYYRLGCYTDEDGVPPYYIYVDKETFLTRKLRTVKITQYGDYDFFSRIKRYGVRDGVMIALETTVNIADMVQEYRTVDYALNPKLSADDFKLPVPWYSKPKNAAPPAQEETKPSQ